MMQDCTYLISAYPGFIPFDSTEEGKTRSAFCHTTYRKSLSASDDVDGVNRLDQHGYFIGGMLIASILGFFDLGFSSLLSG